VFTARAGPGARWQQSCYGSDAGRRHEGEARGTRHRAIRDAAAETTVEFDEAAQGFKAIIEMGAGWFLAVDLD
jgi:hypothetical protein